MYRNILIILTNIFFFELGHSPNNSSHSLLDYNSITVNHEQLDAVLYLYEIDKFKQQNVQKYRAYFTFRKRDYTSVFNTITQVRIGQRTQRIKRQIEKTCYKIKSVYIR